VERSEIDEKYKWNLEEIYVDDAAWEGDYEKVEALVPEVAAYQGRLGESGETLLAFHQKSEEMNRLFDRLFAYAYLAGDRDARVSHYQGLRDRARGLAVQVSAALSWVEPELIAIPQEKVERFFKGTEGLDTYRHSFDDMWRTQEHVLSEGEEKILSLTGDLSALPRTIYDQMMNADLRFGTFLNENGDEVEMTEGRYVAYLRNQDRRVRREAFETYYDGYDDYQHAAAAALAGAIKRDLLYTRARSYGSCAERALDGDNVDVAVLKNLIATINANLEPVRDYFEIRREVMGLDTLYHYDTYVPLTASIDRKFPYEEATETIVDGLAPLGKRYVGDLEKGFASGWVDVYENVGKRSGAYSWGSSALPHPFVLMNYQDTLDDMFTLAHEMGHSMHTFYTVANQPQVYADYSIFVAEVASTTNEAILMDYLLEKTNDRDMRIFLVNHYIRQILGTVYTQVMFSEFELALHEMAEGGEPLTLEVMSGLYHELLVKYGGGVVTYTPDSDIGWARIHHFYRNFYVYKYATSYAAATALARGILAEEPGALDRYLAFLAGGSSDYPAELLKNAGVDLTTPEPIQKTCDLLAELVDELDRLLGEG